MSEQRQNAFERAQARTPLADDRKNRFTRHDENRAVRLKAADTQRARIARNDAQRRQWSGDHRSGGVRTASGVSLDPTTLQMKQAAEADRQPKSPPAIQAPPSAATLSAIILEWERANPEYRKTVFNAQNMANCLLTNVAAGKLAWAYEALDVAYQWLRENNYLEEAPQPRKRGDFSSSSAPKIFPVFLSDDARSAQEDRQRIESAQRMSKEIERALSMPSKDLQRQIRVSISRYGAEAVR